MLRSRRGLSHFGNRRVAGQVDCSLAPGSFEQMGCKKKSPSHYTGEGYSGGSGRCLSTYRQDLEVPSPEVTIKLWVGVLSIEMPLAELSYQFATTILRPDEHFAFTTAESGGGGDGIFKRMSAVQCGLAKIKQLIEHLGGPEREASSRSLDPATVTVAAIRAIFRRWENFLRQASWRSRRQEPSNYMQLWGLGRGRDCGGPAGALRGVSGRSCSGWESHGVGSAPADKPDLDSILDAGVEVSKACGFEIIYEALERQMRLDFQVSLPKPGMPELGGGGAAAMAWVQKPNRALSQSYHVGLLGAGCGIWDDLMLGNVNRVQARAGLVVACADQASIDSGSWIMSTVALLEPCPPQQESPRPVRV